MVQTKMIDAIGSGIKRICQIQSRKFFPLPTFDFDNGKVEAELL
jgi:ATP-dependent DNA helicase RecG